MSNRLSRESGGNCGRSDGRRLIADRYTLATTKTAVLLFLAPPAFAQEHVDLRIVDRVKTEAFDHSKVMDHLYYLSDVYGPRLTGSPEFEQAAKWTVERLTGYGLQNVHLEHWGPLGRNWSLQQSSLDVIEPRYSQLTAVPLAWSASSKGPVTAELIVAPAWAGSVEKRKSRRRRLRVCATGQAASRATVYTGALKGVSP